MTVVTLFGKPGCCLCDEARDAVRSLGSENEFELREVDVSLDPELERVYGERIPVVSIDGAELFELHVDASELRRALAGAGAT
jgi:glutaredoxin